MNKLLVGYEKYDPDTRLGWNFNGRITPSDLVASDDELGGMNEWIRLMYDILIEPHKNPDLATDFLCSPYVDGIDPIEISNITTEKYVYPIEITNASMYFRYTSHISISEKVLNDAKNNQAYVVFVYHREGDMRNYLPRFSELVRQLNLPKEQVLLLHGDHNVDFFKDEPFTYVAIDCFRYWLNTYNIDDIIEYVPDKLFLNYNRIIREHRILMLSLLNNHNLVDNGIVSLGPMSENQLNSYTSTEYFNSYTKAKAHRFLRELAGHSPDGLSLDKDNPAQNLISDHYKNTFVSLVSETLTDSIFFSEKIYKPIIIGHPFILMGAKNQLIVLRSMGFRTFNEFWSEDYDMIDNMYDRAKAIVQILVELNSKSHQELINMRNRMRPVLIHNQQLFRKSVPQQHVGDQKTLVDFLSQHINR